MLRQSRLIPMALFLLGTLSGPVAAQGQRTTVDAPDLFNGQGPAGTIALKSLDQTWRRVAINGPEELKGGGIGQLTEAWTQLIKRL